MNTNVTTFLARFQRQAISLLVVVILLLSQAVALQHNHSGDLQLQSSCDLCLNAGSSGAAIPVNAVTFDFSFTSLPCECFISLLPGNATTTPKARAPPHLPS